MTVKVIDHNYSRIEREIKKMNNSHGEVGFPHDGVLAPGISDNIATIIKIAFIQEFGSIANNIPERPFVRLSFEKNFKKYQEMFKKGIKGINDNRTTTVRIIKEIMVVAEKDMIDTIINLKSPPNAASTIKKKGFDDPLVDGHQMLNTVQSKTVINGATVK